MNPPGAFGLLVRINALQTWRRFSMAWQHSKLWVGTMLLAAVGYTALSFWLFYRGLKFIETFPGLGTLLTERLLFLLFAILFVLLLLSSLIISYTNLFKNRETTFLFSLPIPRIVIFRWKFIESTLLASWAFLLLIAPLLAAYGLTRHVPWHFYAVTVALVGLFIVLPSVLGAWAAIALARLMDRRSFQIGILLLALAALAGLAFYFKPEPFSDESLETRVLSVLDRMLVRTRFAQYPLLPSYWMSSAVLNWTEKALVSSAFFAAVLLSNVLLFGFLSLVYSGNIFYDAASAVNSRGGLLSGWKRKARAGQPNQNLHDASFLERSVARIPRILPDQRALIVKDLRIFWRDTTQWGQTFVLFGLLGAYIINLRQFSTQLSNPFWINLVAFLNLGACSLNLATLTTRFVFPQFSLEGKRVWVVGLAPLGLVRAVKTKFYLAFGLSLCLTLGLICLSCHMLNMELSRMFFFGCAITAMTFTLNGLATGLGALYPNFREENPSKIVSGFGGTFCLILSFLYILGSIVLLALGSPWGARGLRSPEMIMLGVGGFVLFSIAVGLWPLVAGLKRVARFEQI